MRTTAYIGVGSNLDRPKNHVSRALHELNELTQTNLLDVSSLYRSAPLGPQDQDDYINAVAALQTDLTAHQLLQVLKTLEVRHGRGPAERHWGPRPLDLDILLYGEQIISTPRLTVPHPGLAERAFVLYPLAELAPQLEVPEAGPLALLLQHCPNWDIEQLDRG